METVKNKETKVELINEKQDSISVSRSGKGVYSFDSKIYYNGDKESYNLVIAKLKSIDEKLSETFKNPESD